MKFSFWGRRLKIFNFQPPRKKLINYLRKIDRNLIVTHETADWKNFKRRLAVDATKNNEIVDTVTGEVITDIYAVTPPDKFIVNTGE